LVEEEPLFSILLLMFIMVFTFGLLNMIVAFVVEKTMKQAKVMGDLSRHESQREVAQGLLQMKTIFEEADTDGNGTISKKEFLEALQTNEKVQDSFERVGIPTHDAETLYAVIDADGSGNLTMEELLEGCARIRGASNPEWDLLAMHSLLRCLARQVNKVRRDQNTFKQNKISVANLGLWIQHRAQVVKRFLVRLKKYHYFQGHPLLALFRKWRNLQTWRKSCGRSSCNRESSSSVKS